jgi:tetratricopeptide (TPR) repeat protein
VTPPAAPNEEIEIAPQPVEENTTWLAGLAKSEAEKAGGLPPEAVTFAQPGGETVTSRRPENLPVRPAAAQVPAADDWQATLTQAQVALDEGQIIPALEGYTHLINSGQLIDEAIHDLRDALYHYPVEVTIWQALGDAYMRSNRIQDALDAYTKAEELLR